MSPSKKDIEVFNRVFEMAKRNICQDLELYRQALLDSILVQKSKTDPCKEFMFDMAMRGVSNVLSSESRRQAESIDNQDRLINEAYNILDQDEDI